MSYKDYYKILGINEEASAPEVEVAYLKLSSRYSSEQFEDDELNQSILQDITEAFMVLGDPELRIEYDSQGTDWKLPDSYFENPSEEEEEVAEEEEKNNIEESFKTFFEKGLQEVLRMSKQGYKQNSYNFHINVPFRLEEALHGSLKTIELEHESIELPIPPGAFTGQRLRIAGKGKVNPETDARGDLWVTLIEKPHAYFFRKGKDILYHASIDIFTALLGGKITIPTLEGKASLNIPKGVNPNTQLKIVGAGLPLINQPNQKGDFFVELHIEIPKDLNEEEISLIKQLKRLRDK